MLSIKNFLNSLIMKKYKYLITFVFLCFLGNSHARDSNLFELYVLDVVDGDTIKVKFENKIKKIRLSAIDAPEMKQSSGKESKKFLSDLIKKKKLNFIGLELIDMEGYWELFFIMTKMLISK